MAQRVQADEATEEATFLTGLGSGRGTDKSDDLKITNEDVIAKKPWRAHTDAINWVTYIEDLDNLASCSFDCNVFVWDVNGEQPSKVGSLVLGNKACPPDKEHELDAEQRKFKANWKISQKVVNLKEDKYREELAFAQEKLEENDKMDYNYLKAKAAEKHGKAQGLEETRPMTSALTREDGGNSQAGQPGATQDKFEGMNQDQVDNEMLNFSNR